MSCVRLTTLLAVLMLGASSSYGADATVYVYLQSLPADASRLTFTINAVTVTGETGQAAPLKIALPSAGGRQTSRQRLLAVGPVLAGTYRGLTIRFGKASVERPSGGTAALLVPDGALEIDAPFTVSRDRPVVLWLTLQGGSVAADGVRFAPTLAARVADHPNAGRAGFVSNSRSNSITVFDKRLREAAAVIPTCAGPTGMTIDQRQARLYVACARDDEIEAIDVRGGEIVERARLAPGDGPRELALTPDGRTLLSADTGSNSIGILDASPLARLDRIRVGDGPAAIAIEPSGRRAFVFNTLSNSISVVDIPSRSVVATISTDWPPLRGEFNARGDRLYVIHGRSAYMTVIDPSQLTVLSRTRLRIGLGAMKVDPRRGLIYLGGPDDDTVEFYDPTTLLPIGALKTPSGVSFLAEDADEDVLYMVSGDTRSVLVGGLGERKVVSEIDVGEAPYWVSVMGER